MHRFAPSGARRPVAEEQTGGGTCGLLLRDGQLHQVRNMPVQWFPGLPEQYVLLTAAVAPSGDEGAVPVRRYLDAVALWCLRWGGAVRDSMAAIVHTLWRHWAASPTSL